MESQPQEKLSRLVFKDFVQQLKEALRLNKKRLHPGKTLELHLDMQKAIKELRVLFGDSDEILVPDKLAHQLRRAQDFINKENEAVAISNRTQDNTQTLLFGFRSVVDERNRRERDEFHGIADEFHSLADEFHSLAEDILRYGGTEGKFRRLFCIFENYVSNVKVQILEKFFDDLFRGWQDLKSLEPLIVAQSNCEQKLHFLDVNITSVLLIISKDYDFIQKFLQIPNLVLLNIHERTIIELVRRIGNNPESLFEETDSYNLKLIRMAHDNASAQIFSNSKEFFKSVAIGLVSAIKEHSRHVLDRSHYEEAVKNFLRVVSTYSIYCPTPEIFEKCNFHNPTQCFAYSEHTPKANAAFKDLIAKLFAEASAAPCLSQKDKDDKHGQPWRIFLQPLSSRSSQCRPEAAPEQQIAAQPAQQPAQPQNESTTSLLEMTVLGLINGAGLFLLYKIGQAIRTSLERNSSLGR